MFKKESHYQPQDDVLELKALLLLTRDLLDKKIYNYEVLNNY